MDTGAIRPNFIGVPKQPVLVEEEPMKDFVEEEKNIAQLENHAGWQAIQKMIQDEIDSLDIIVSPEATEGLSYEDIGRNAVVASAVKARLQGILGKVKDAKDAVERANGSNK